MSELSNYHTVYISPHLDDVAFSCAGSLLLEEQKPLSITIFSDAEPENKKQAFVKRQQEESVAAVRGNYDFLFAGFNDLRNTKNARYFGLIWGEMEPHLITSVYEYLQKIVEQTQAKKLIAPLGVGRHVDHRICYEAVCKLHSNYPELEIWFYEDRPYSFPVYSTEVRLVELGYSVDVDYGMYLESLSKVRYMSHRNNEKKLARCRQHVEEISALSNHKEVREVQYITNHNLPQIWNIVSAYASQVKFFIGNEQQFAAECQNVALRYNKEKYAERRWRLF
ncbi:PIG-L deacetylase family protein [Candidatus Uabimicrobium amorphum]|uniref:GlcNAc-PI de-N-acetylase n=1 Tax=Uabimicrobium amorphum TaxID=2596890 RepID=A0A5S9IQT6_UABAM|nr:PIG-L family deacetylase [Candidatus Uabimicrobium amorphum]BBM85881.1 GlcNAc-PI de-N-acetylase [Candidatus Uabimicrobium amorphum]